LRCDVGVTTQRPRYDRYQSYDWNYSHVPSAADVTVPDVQGGWRFCGLPVASPLGVPAGPLLNGAWCLYYASLGFDVLTYKTVRSRARSCYPMPNLQPVECGLLNGTETELPATEEMRGSWAVSYGMPSKTPEVWQKDVAWTRRSLSAEKVLVVSVVATVQNDWTLEDVADDYAACAGMAVDSGADVVEVNFSCPNVSTCDGQLYQQPSDAGKVAATVKARIGKVPLIAKVGHVADARAAGQLLDALAPHVAAIAMTNSVATQVRSSDGLLFEGERRGICGAAILEASIAQVMMFRELICSQNLSVELIGVGGIGAVEDVRRYLAAGASACHIASAAMTDPDVALRIRAKL